VIRTRIRDPKKIAKLYTRLSRIYDPFTGHEPRHHREALKLAAIKEGDLVLEVAVGTGRAVVGIAEAVGQQGRVYGVDLTEAMLRQAEAKLRKEGLLPKVELAQGSAFSLPFEDGKFDVLYNSYMLDLIDTPQILPVLLEFKRVLRPGGELVLVNMSKNTKRKTLFEFMYEKGLMTYGNCRPVLAEPLAEQAGFENIRRAYRRDFSWLLLTVLTGTEIVLANKPA
jgi:demethylmenaquinone methyltransferase/2-methoxy-6-polyprenyl-1,4-benzoquinol methylase